MDVQLRQVSMELSCGIGIYVLIWQWSCILCAILICVVVFAVHVDMTGMRTAVLQCCAILLPKQ